MGPSLLGVQPLTAVAAPQGVEAQAPACLISSNPAKLERLRSHREVPVSLARSNSSERTVLRLPT